MQFKHPEILFFLFLLLIPLLIHLFQLQRFKKEAFTNVAFLKNIELQTRKSAKLKKLLILISRMLAFAALIMAFSKPFLNKSKNLDERHRIVYVDNSLSLQASENSSIDQIQKIKNILLEKLLETNQYTTFSNNEKFQFRLDNKSLNNELIALDYYPIRKDINQVLLQINNAFKNETNTLLDIYLVSDFQNINNTIDTALIHPKYEYNLIDLSNKASENISLDTLWIAKNDGNQISLKARFSSWNMAAKNFSVSLTLDEVLYGKTTVNLESGISENIEFLIPMNGSKTGKLSLTDHKLNFDNELFFTIPEKQKKKVLVIGTGNEFLERIYRENEFSLTKVSYASLDQSVILDQDLIIISELEKISNPLNQSLQAFVQQKGNLVIIPGKEIDLETYEKLLESFDIGNISGQFNEEKSISEINYDHPFFNKVFEKEINNFQYPTIDIGYTLNIKNASSILRFADQTDFVAEIEYFENSVYWIASPLSASDNSFINSPLIVPLFYNFSVQNVNDSSIYLTIGRRNELNINSNGLENDIPLKIVQNELEYIPMQTKSIDNIKVTTEDYPISQGIYELKIDGDLLRKIAYNYDRIENDLNFMDLKPLASSYNNIHLFNSLENGLKEGNDRNLNKDLWQLFIIFALVFLILEILLQKFLKN